MLLNIPISKMRILDLLRFERVSSLFSASFFFASFLLCFSALLFFSSHPTTTPSFHLPFASRITSPSESLPSSLLLLSALGYSFRRPLVFAISPRRPLGFLIVPPKSARFAYCPPEGRSVSLLVVTVLLCLTCPRRVMA